MTVSVVIPALNEASRIEGTLAAVTALSGPKEVLVVDVGSVDETVARAARAARVLCSAPGRAAQMNTGAEAATGDALFFLHADTIPPPGNLDAIRSALADPSVEAGAFRLAFDKWTPLLRFYSFCTRFHRPSLCFGDRGLFVRRSVFETLGGFAPIPIFEDLELVRRLHRRGGFRFLPGYVVTAARRFERNGPLRQQMRNLYLWLHFMRGSDPERLAHLYRYSSDVRG